MKRSDEPIVTTKVADPIVRSADPIANADEASTRTTDASRTWRRSDCAYKATLMVNGRSVALMVARRPSVEKRRTAD